MATQQNTQTISLIASADLSAKQYHFVEMTGVNTVSYCNGTTDKAIGILQNDPISGGVAVVAIAGTSKLVAGGVVSAGGSVAPKADGRAQTAVATQYARAIVLETSANDGDIVEAALIPLTVMA
jgi:hypothetical protein